MVRRAMVTYDRRSERRERVLSLFEAALSVPAEEIEFLLSGTSLVPWADYVLNPRRLRGSDFLMRWSQGQWSEERVVQAVNDTSRYYALPYGPSGTAPEGDVREFELYFERLEKAGLGKMKRPDLLIVRAADRSKVDRLVHDLGGLKELPFTSEDDPRMKELITRAVVATECENSLWRAKQMPSYGAALTPQQRLRGKLGLKKTAVVPTVILKEEDRRPLRNWQRAHGVPVHIWHVFYDMAFGISFDDAERLIRSGQIEETKQVFQAPGGATTRKSIYKSTTIMPTPWAKLSRSQVWSLQASPTRTVTSSPMSDSKAEDWHCPVMLSMCWTSSDS